jgi:hypothetical protein
MRASSMRLRESTKFFTPALTSAAEIKAELEQRGLLGEKLALGSFQRHALAQSAVSGPKVSLAAY